MSEKAAKDLKKSWRTINQDHFKNDKKMLFGSKIQRIGSRHKHSTVCIYFLLNYRTDSRYYISKLYH